MSREALPILFTTHEVCTTADVDVFREQGGQVNASSDCITGNVDSELRDEKGERYVTLAEHAQRNGSANVQAKNTAARAPGPPFIWIEVSRS